MNERDISFIDPDTWFDLVLLDLGLGKQNSYIDVFSQVRGNKWFMAPEQGTDKVHEWTDIWSLAAMFTDFIKSLRYAKDGYFTVDESII